MKTKAYSWSDMRRLQAILNGKGDAGKIQLPPVPKNTKKIDISYSSSFLLMDDPDLTLCSKYGLLEKLLVRSMIRGSSGKSRMIPIEPKPDNQHVAVRFRPESIHGRKRWPDMR